MKSDISFFGTYQSHVDRYGRIVIPKQLRKSIKDKKKDFVQLFNFKFGCIIICDIDHALSIMNIDEKSFSMKERKLATLLSMGDIHYFNFGPDGRTRIDGVLIHDAKIYDKAVFVGAGDHIQLWSYAVLENIKESTLDSTNT